MEALEILHQIDSDAWILKTKLAARFDKRYGTKLTSVDADKLSFLDIITAPDCDDSLDLYTEIKTIADHGVTNEQKNFLYKIFPFFSNSDPDGDFEGMIAMLEKIIERRGNSKSCAGARMVLNNNEEDFTLATYIRRPFSILRMQRLGDVELQAILVQNGSVLILEVVTDVDDFM